ncbi:dorsal-ventral patterning tolloid-like protein 1 [Mercenaria mercenaria]|uniref:dorsal-ventral patterning tolloid-like protein 1 n=1 Tax=Mercenaria mercenaria TaxID=6596 RepID=UPI001E1D6149|nr:dorsal-ventral patterning tolloid-like protein 1 [Mercenaria mercenaria]
MCLKFEMAAFIYACFTVCIVWTGSTVIFTDCGGELLADADRNETVTSPNFAKNMQLYPDNANCTWIIRCETPEQNVVINFDFFALEGVENCAMYDWVTIDNGEFIGLGDIGRFCGDAFCDSTKFSFLPYGELISNGSVVTINFSSDDVISYPGFKLKYTCSGAADEDTDDATESDE